MRLTFAAFLATAVLSAPAAADDASDIRARLETWTDDFNAGRVETLCDLFSQDAVSEARSQPERRYAEICKLVGASIDDPARDYRYQLDLREVLVAGDVAVVRLTWTLFISPLNVTSVEPGLYVFRKEADGEWRVIRSLVYEEEG